MKKIIIIGSSGAGKTWLAQKLRHLLKIKVFHLDRLFLLSNWKKKAWDTRIDILQNILLEEQWIIEGTYRISSEFCLTEADTIIFLDLHPFLCLQRIIQRHIECYGRTRRDIPKGCTDRLTLLLMWRVLIFPWRGRRAFQQKLQYCDTKRIIRLRSPKEIDEFLTQLEQEMGHVQKSASAVSPVDARSLVGNVRLSSWLAVFLSIICIV
jgi:adenylate kinase family enzyme